MEIGECKSANDAAQSLIRIRQFAPYKYGGQWFCACSNGTGVAFRKLADWKKRMLKDNPANIAGFECMIVDK